jgi:hypothetical protein
LEALHLTKHIHCVLSICSGCPCIEGLFDNVTNVTNVACPFNPSINLHGKRKG